MDNQNNFNNNQNNFNSQNMGNGSRPMPMNNGMPMNNNRQNKPKKKSKGLGIIIGIVAILILLIIVVIAIPKGDKEPIVDKIVKMRWNEIDNTIIYFTEREYILTAEMALKQNNNIAGQMNVSNTEKVKTIEVIGDNFADNVELIIDENKELITIDGKYYIKNKRPQYPKTFSECAELISGVVHVASTYKSTIIHALNTLYVCRDAYWKVDNWKADFGDSIQIKYGIIDTIIYDKTVNYFDLHNPLLKLFVFKTPETRNEFYKNFKDYILKLQDD